MGLGVPDTSGGALFNITYANTTQANSTNYVTGVEIAGFWDIIASAGLLGSLLLGGASILIGLFLSKDDKTIAVFAGIAIGVFWYFSTTILSLVIYSINQKFPAWVTGLEVLMFVPLAVGYIVALIEFIRGND